MPAIEIGRVLPDQTQIDIAAATTRGDRGTQEDASVVRTWATAGGGAPANATLAGLTLAVLADGMGGHAGGEIASRLVCEHAVTGFEQLRPTRAGRLIAGLEAANAAIAAMVDRNPALQSMGSTMIACAFSRAAAIASAPIQLEWVSVGDSPLYLFRRAEIAQLNADHSLAPVLDQMVADGLMTRAAADADGRRHMLRSAVTGEEIELIDVSKAPLMLAAGDVVILASDGVETLPPEEIADIIAAAIADGWGADAMARCLIATINSRHKPHQDNATVVVARVF